ncbi:hypothetical protein L1987_43149 [Smallanthus sonchifolius]|uniref:Uncharacterized protein n=1 Tax=Smallanthus sonchifolius TaxID=185202 RepID=A0ACB9GKT8_9ASTR|nr:hypothetical protein L1987_43149 [Smallanthus sonchifolius]
MIPLNLKLKAVLDALDKGKYVPPSSTSHPEDSTVPYARDEKIQELEAKLKACKENAQALHDLQSIVEKQQKELLLNYRQNVDMQILSENDKIEALMEIDDVDLNDDDEDDGDSLEVEIEKDNIEVTYEGEGVEITSTMMKDIISPEISFEFQDQIFEEQTPEVEKPNSAPEEPVQEEAPQFI